MQLTKQKQTNKHNHSPSARPCDHLPLQSNKQVAATTNPPTIPLTKLLPLQSGSAGAGIGLTADARTGAGTGTGTGAGTGARTGARTGTGAGAGRGTETGTGAGTEVGTRAGTGAGTVTETGTGAGTGAGSLTLVVPFAAPLILMTLQHHQKNNSPFGSSEHLRQGG